MLIREGFIKFVRIAGITILSVDLMGTAEELIAAALVIATRIMTRATMCC